MSKKGIKIDDLLESLQDERVVALLTQSLKPIMEEIFNGFVEAFSSKLENLVAKSAEALITKHCETTDLKISALETENELLKARLDESDNLSRLDNIVIYGLPETSNELPRTDTSRPFLRSSPTEHSAVHSVLDLCNIQLGVKVSDSDISYAHRVPGSSRERYRPVIVRFISRRIRNSVLAARRALKDLAGSSRIFINEHLTKQNSQIFAGARKLVRERVLHSAWTRGGITFVRLSDADDEKPRKIASIKCLESITQKNDLFVMLPPEKSG